MASSSAAVTAIGDCDPDGLFSAISEQKRELMEAQAIESDLDLAFRLQLQEALSASLVLSSAPSSSASPVAPPPPIPPADDASVSFPSLQYAELSAYDQMVRDRALLESETCRMKEDINRSIHDEKVARAILTIPDDEWEDWGDEFERPYGEGTSSTSEPPDTIFGIYFKGLVSEEQVNGKNTLLSGIGVAICDPKDNLIFEVAKPMPVDGKSRRWFEVRALIAALNAALVLDLKRITFFCDYYTLYQYVIGKWTPKQRKIKKLVDEVAALRKKFTYCNAQLVARNDVKFAFKFARDAIISQIARPVSSLKSASGKIEKEQCVICLEEKDICEVFSIEPCAHRYCFSCMRQHVEVKLLHGIVPKCPHGECKSDLKINSCHKFLTPKLIEMMTQRIKEASIPPTEKVYCPYPRCSALMSKKEISGNHARDGTSGERNCLKCNKRFCIECKVPWHGRITCLEYKRRHPLSSADDYWLKNLANRNLWRQCIKCNHMIELSEGCYHMTCRCGYEFCYNCGAEWKNKKATCQCPLWVEENILDDSDLDDDEDDDEDDDVFYISDEDGYVLR